MMTYEAYMKKSLVELRKLASAMGVKDVYSYRKAPLVEEMLKCPEHLESLPEQATAEAPKRRGRPPKEKKEEQTEQAPAEKKRRGRPPKAQAAHEIEPTEAQAAKVEEKAARPSYQKSNCFGIKRPHKRSSAMRYQSTDEPLDSAIQEMLDSGDCGQCEGVLEILPDGYGFIRPMDPMSGQRDVYVSIAQIRKFNLATGDQIKGRTRPAGPDGDQRLALLYIDLINEEPPYKAAARTPFEELTPIIPNERLTLENSEMKDVLILRIIDLICPIGKGQRGLIVAPPRTGKTSILRQVANAISINHPEVTLMMLLIDERPEEVTEMQRSIQGEVIYSTFDEMPEHHTRVSEMVLERAQRLVEQGRDVVILLDSITRLARAYNMTITPTGRSLSGGLDPGTLFKPKRFFGAARNIEEGGSLTILATALVDTGSRMDEIIFEEFKGTGNMELQLDRTLSERGTFPAVNIFKSGTRQERFLLSDEEYKATFSVRRFMTSGNAIENAENLLEMLRKTRDNEHFIKAMEEYMRICKKEGYTTTKQDNRR